MPISRRVLPALVAAAVAIAGWVSGCAHYQLGTGSAPTFKTLFIEPIENETTLPQAIGLVSTQLREAFIRDGRLRIVATPAEADAVLSVRLTRYARDIATVLPNDTGLARKFELSLNATATLRERASGQARFSQRPLSVRRQAFTDQPQSPGQFNNQLQTEYQTLPLLAEALAQSAAHAVLDTW